MIIIMIIIKIIMATRILILVLRRGFVALGKSFSLSFFTCKVVIIIYPALVPGLSSEPEEIMFFGNYKVDF